MKKPSKDIRNMRDSAVEIMSAPNRVEKATGMISLNSPTKTRPGGGRSRVNSPKRGFEPRADLSLPKGRDFSQVKGPFWKN